MNDGGIFINGRNFNLEAAFNRGGFERKIVDKYKAKLNQKYDIEKDLNLMKYYDDRTTERAKRTIFLADSVFGLYVYDDIFLERLGFDMLEVIASIHTNGIKDEQMLRHMIDYSDNDKYKYYSMINTPFLVDKVEWGISVRQSYFDTGSEYTIEGNIPKVINAEGVETDLSIHIPIPEINHFIHALLEWSAIK